MPKVKCTISEVIPAKKNKQNPIIAHFSGEPNDDFVANLDILPAKNKEDENCAEILLAVSEDNLYDGIVGRGYPTDLKRTFIAIRKKGSDEMKLVEVSECDMMSYHYNSLGTQKVSTLSEQSNMSAESARRILFKEFGGKKASIVLDRKEKMKINVDIVKDQLDKTLLDLSQNNIKTEDAFDKSKEQQDQLLEDMIPKMNKEATKLVDVYNIEELVGVEILESLKEEALNILKTDPDELPIKPSFLTNIIKNVQRSKTPDDDENLLKIKSCIFIDALITYFRQVNQVRLNAAVRLQPLSKVTNKLDSYIRKKFSQPSIRKLTKTNYIVHKATCFIIVLSLLVSERYEMDIQHIIEEIGVAKTNLFKIINSIAVRPKAKSNIVSIRLPSQLKAFVTNIRRRRTL